MNTGWQFRVDSTPTPIEVDAMVAVLEGRHGIWAADVAEFGRAGRSWAWANVADRVRHRTELRQHEPVARDCTP